MSKRFYFTKDPPRPCDYRERFLSPDAIQFLYVRFLNPPKKTYNVDLMEELEDYSTVAGIRIFLKTKGYTEVTEHYVKKLMIME